MADATKSKKRKDEKKWYAVKVGLRPGVYETWDECSENTNHQRGAVYKSFTSKEDAEAFVAGKKIPNRGGKAEPIKYYAVARGNFTGIFHDWDKASKAIYKSTKPKYKKFDTLGEAVRFIKEWGDEDTIEKVQALVDGDSEFESEVEEHDELEPGLVHIYTDGSGLGNGYPKARAGMGVYFGPSDSRNISERLEGEYQTNQRAELFAVLRALENVPVTEGVQILTDSRYAINCIQKWAPIWAGRDWKTVASSSDVMNKDVVQAIMKKIVEREAKRTRTVFTWVKGHSKYPGNVEADKLAVAAAYLEQENPVMEIKERQQAEAAAEAQKNKTRKKLKSERHATLKKEESPELDLRFEKEETPDLDDYSSMP
ncbi:Ribonuclease H [Colletotrichum siamense]|uniref:Ribonuclease H n=1 Tax=Colletotrichum siamense TaxID=690259 RepID=A0A9P5EKS8_COLSI|nr:Ribonuclease H [Colletotrichum siamense]KAF4852295.1 Ribonuclease H [Colletotrichum siamense]